MKFDVFISHASEDKDEVVRPLAGKLRELGFRVWLDETEIKLGDSLRRSIDNGLSKSKFGLVVLSPDFLKKEWPQKELDSLVAREDGSAKVILPIWHKVTKTDIINYSPLLADKLAAPTSKGLDYIAEQVAAVIKTIDTPSETLQTEQSTSKHQSYELQDLVVEMLDRVQELVDSDLPGITGIPSGFYDLDRFTSGFQAESLIILGGGPSSGKTAFALNIAEHVSCNERLPVLIFSPNESAKSITNRMICACGGIESHHLRTGLLTDAEWPSLIKSIEKFRHAAVHIHDKNDLSLEDIQSECRRLVKLQGALGLVIIDSLQSLSQNQDPKDILRHLKGLAREIHTPIILTTDLNQESEARLDKRPILKDLSKIGEIDRYGDLALLIFRAPIDPSEPSEMETIELIIAKQKDGSPTGSVRLGFHRNTGKFEPLAGSWFERFKSSTDNADKQQTID